MHRRTHMWSLRLTGALTLALLLALSACSGWRAGSHSAEATPAAEPTPAPAATAPRPVPSSPTPATAASGSNINGEPAAGSKPASAPNSAAAHDSTAQAKRAPAPAPVHPAPAVQSSTAVPKPSVPSPAPAHAAPAAPLDLGSLEQRLKDTHAIGVFTKLSLKNQVDDLLTQLRAHYRGDATVSLAGLRQRYDLLMLKVLSLLQDGDPSLAQAIGSSREAIWGILSDPSKLATVS